MDFKGSNSLNDLPDQVLFEIFKYLPPRDLLNAGQTCTDWCRVSYDEILWKRLLFKDFKIKRGTPIAPGKPSWYEEYKRLSIHVPNVCTEVLHQHYHEVLHVSYSHDGTMFATSSKDGYIIVWSSSFPASIKYSFDTKTLDWVYTQFSKFNQSDSLLLVSGVHHAAPGSTSGEVAVFSIKDEFELKCRVLNKPYDILGTWVSEGHLLFGDITWFGRLFSDSGLWIKEASQETDSETTPSQQLFKFKNICGGTVSNIMVADETSAAKRRTLTLRHTDDHSDADLSSEPGKILIFTKGSKAYTPHQIGFKKIRNANFPKVIDEGPSMRESHGSRGRLDEGPSMRESHGSRGRFNIPDSESTDNLTRLSRYDEIDHLIDFHGHIVGMSLSPDHRYLYVNNRPWPTGYRIDNPREPPPIAQEIDIHVIDLKTFQASGPVLRSHKGFSPHDECFLLFLDVTDDYVASGSEDKHGYIWDRNYEVLLAKLPHSKVVNSVAFNPKDPEMIVTTSDDHTIKVWRSKNLASKLNGPLPVVQRRARPPSQED